MKTPFDNIVETVQGNGLTNDWIALRTLLNQRGNEGYKLVQAHRQMPEGQWVLFFTRPRVQSNQFK